VARDTARYMDYDWRPQEIAALHDRPGRVVGEETRERIEKEGIERAAAGSSRVSDESTVTQAGYGFLARGRVEDGVRLLRFNALAHPASANALDSGRGQGLTHPAGRSCYPRVTRGPPAPGKRSMFRTPVSILLCAAAAAAPASAAQEARTGTKPEFAAPVRLTAGGQYVKTEAPGYACPCWADVDADGVKDLIVGQFAGGRMKVYRGVSEGGLAAGTWLEAEGETAEVPGIW